MNENNKKTVFRIFPAWNEAGEERFLEGMARQGWQLSRVGAGMFYHFEKDEPADMTYRLDFVRPGKFDRGEYLAIFKAAGWEHIAEFSNWHYFRTRKGEGSSPEIFTDRASRIAKYKRIAGFLLFFLFFGFWNFGNLMRSRTRYGWLWDAVVILQAAVVFLLAYGAVRLGLVIRRIRRESSDPKNADRA